jgi:hypothetical protein
MSGLIIIRCPYTGLNVQTSLTRQAGHAAQTYEAVACAACAGVHLVDLRTATVAGQDK